MKIRCLHGYFIFEELKPGQLSDFMSLFGFDLVAQDDHFTFAALAGAPRYSILGGTYLGAPAIKTFEGHPWQIMRENQIVYNFNLGLVLPIVSTTQVIKLNQGSNYFLSSGLIQPGSVTEDGSRVKDYAAFYLFDKIKFKYSEVSFE
jgi:hypothetical protein